MQRNIFLGPVAALALFLLGCDGGAKDASAATIAVQTAAREASASSARFTMELRASGPGVDVASMPAEGILDFSSGTGEFIVPQEGGAPPIRTIWHGGAAYQSWLDTGYWIKSEDTGGPADMWTPSRTFDEMRDARDAELVGHETIDGYDATRYRFRILAEDLDPEWQDTMKGIVTTVDVWISDHRVHRIVSDQLASEEAHEGLRGQRFIAEINLTDWGVDVVVEPPDPSLVKSFEELASMPGTVRFGPPATPTPAGAP